MYCLVVGMLMLNGCFFQGEIKLSVTIEDEANKDLPSAVQLYRPIRQYVYGVLFSLAEAKKRVERLAMRRNRLPECEWIYVLDRTFDPKSPTVH